MKKLLLLGGFPQMIDIVMTAKDMGIYTIVVDKDEHSPAKRFADRALHISTDRIDLLEKICREEKVDGVFTGFEDFNIHIACALANRLHLPFYATDSQIATVTDKLRFKQACRTYGVPTIEQYTESEALKQAKYPYIVKPADSYGSRGITVCRNQIELLRGIEKAKNASATKKTIIERFIDHEYGTELFYTVVNGNIHLSATADRYTVRNGETTVPLPVAEVFPSHHRDEMQTILDTPIRAMLKGMGIRNGLVLVQALYDGDGGYFVYEMAYRFTGEQHYRLLEKQNGVSLARMMILLALGEDIGEYDTPLLDDTAFHKPSVNLALVLNEGKIGHIEGLQKVYQLDEVISYNLTHAEHDEIAPSGDYSHMLIRINMVAESYSRLCAAIKAVDDAVSVTSDAGEDMLAMHFLLN